MLSAPRIMHDRTISIPIKQTLSTSMKDTSPKGEYSIKQNIFDLKIYHIDFDMKKFLTKNIIISIIIIK